MTRPLFLASDTDRMGGACAPRAHIVACDTAAHLPAAVANETVESGYPARPGRVRSLPIELSGTPQVGKPAHNAKAPTGELGWLTPIRPSKSGGGMWFWRCRCGDESVLKNAKDTRAAVRRGQTPKCKRDCKGAP